MKKIFVLIGIRIASSDLNALWQECGRLNDSGTSTDTICRCLRQLNHDLQRDAPDWREKYENIRTVLDKYEDVRKAENREKAAIKREKDKEKNHFRNIGLELKREAENFLAANHLAEFTFSIRINLTKRRFEVLYHVGRTESLHLNFSSLIEDNKRILVAHLDQHLRDLDEAVGPSRNAHEWAEYYSTRTTADEWFGDEIPTIHPVKWAHQGF